MPMQPILEKYRKYLSLDDNIPSITLGEGNTPLVRSVSIGPEMGVDMYFKLEGCNPTGSFKDRGMVSSTAGALADGYKRMICASTGNTAAACAAYGARFDLNALLFVPKGNVALGKLAQALVYGAQVILVNGNYDVALQWIKYITDKRDDLIIVNSINPARVEGQKTAAFEIVDALDDAPDYHFIPVGNGANIYSYWEGFKTMKAAGKATKLPKMVGGQAAKSAPIVDGKIIENPETLATAIRIGNPAKWNEVLETTKESGGDIRKYTDDTIIDAYLLLAREEGIFCEPSSATSVAAAIDLIKSGVVPKGSTMTFTLTGNGLKDPDTATERGGATATMIDLEPNQQAVDKFIDTLS